MESSWATSEATRKAMLGNRSRDTQPELAVRRILHSRGLRFRVNARPIDDIRSTADIVFTRRKVAVFIDGCFWHGCSRHYRAPASNREYWSEKLRRNQERDIESTLTLQEAGWTVLRYWSHESPMLVADEIQRTLRNRDRSP